MKHFFLFFCCLSIGIATMFGQKQTDANIHGHVIDQETQEHIPYANIIIKGTSIGGSTDASGHFFLRNCPEGKFTIVMRIVGYQQIEKEIEIIKKKSLEVNFEAKKMISSLNPIVISSNRNETNRRQAPTIVNVISPEKFENTNSLNLGQALNFETGVRIENNCQNCGFSQVRINGLDGSYSQILIDSRPVFSALAGVYGLEQIPTNMIDRVEVVRGGGSALYGSSAIGGTINIITKEPIGNSGNISHTTMNFDGTKSFDHVTSFNGSVVGEDGKSGIMIFGQNRERDGYFRDSDEFSEIPTLQNRSVGFRSFYKPGPFSKISLEYHSMHEYRRGGDQFELPPHEAVIAEELRHSINGGGVKFDQFSADGKSFFSIYGAAQNTVRKSYYGGGDPLRLIDRSQIDTSAAAADIEDDYVNQMNNRLVSYGISKDLSGLIGGQYSYNFDKLLFMPSELTVGLEHSIEHLTDQSGLQNLYPTVIKPIDQVTQNSSFFFQNEWKNDMWGFLLGARLDKHNLVKPLIFSPRINIRFNPTEDLNFRATYSEGFRAPQYFDEDLHTELAGGDPIKRILGDDLKEERSQSVSGSVDYYIDLGAVKLNFLVEGFYTRLKNKFIQQEGSEGDLKIRTIVNAESESAKVYGTNIEGRMAFGKYVQLQTGTTIQRSVFSEQETVFDHTDEDGEDGIEITSRNFMRTPNLYSYFVLTYTPIKQFSATISGNHTGSMYVPHNQYEDLDLLSTGTVRGSKVNRIQETKSFFVLNLKVAYDFKISRNTTMQVNMGVQNIMNEYQSDFDTGAGKAAPYVYGPSLPRCFFMGVKMSF